MSSSPTAASTEGEADLYWSIARGEHAEGELGRIVFCVSTDDLSEGKGDPYVALGLAKYLNRLGWGVSLWPMSKWSETPSPAPDVAISMIDSFVPGHLADSTATVAWVRNWTSVWADLPYLSDFDAVWCSSPASLAAIAARYEGPTQVVPIGVDTEVFHPTADDRTTPIVTTTNFWGAERGIQRALDLVAETLPVTWVGANGEHLRASPKIDHRDTVDFFRLADLYSDAIVVVDDLIPPAAEFGTHNSRLFEALACGALPLTSTALGLDALGLAEVPVWAAGDDLLATLTALLDDPEGTAALAERLAGVVRRDHTYERRAAAVTEGLAAARDRRRAREPRASWIAWIAVQQAKLRTASMHLDERRAAVALLEADAVEGSKREQEAGRAIEAYRSEADRLRHELEVIHASRAYRALTRANSVKDQLGRKHP